MPGNNLEIKVYKILVLLVLGNTLSLIPVAVGEEGETRREREVEALFEASINLMWWCHICVILTKLLLRNIERRLPTMGSTFFFCCCCISYSLSLQLIVHKCTVYAVINEIRLSASLQHELVTQAFI